jgi:tol-pal system protein YbgF
MNRWLVLAAVMVSSGVHAGPAEDALARVAELQKGMQAQQERIEQLESQSKNQGAITLLNQVEALKAEIARLRGFQEEQAYQMDVAEKRVKDLYVDLDGRLNQVSGQVKELASRPVAPVADAVRLQPAQTLSSVPTTEPPPAVDADTESRAYADAHALVKSGKYKEAVQAMQAFQEQFPKGSLAPNAVYWTGFSQVNLGDFVGAAASYQKLINDYPTSSKAPDAMLSLARSRIQINDLPQARTVLEQLIAKHPLSKAAATGKKLLATLN